MKWFSKINRGAIVTAVVLICVAVYLISLNFIQAKEKVQIKEACKKYIAIETKYEMLDEKYRTSNPKIPKEELASYIEKAKSEISSLYLSGVKIYKIDGIEKNLQNQAKGIGVVYKYEKNISRFKSINFNGKTVSVEMLVDTVIDGPTTTYNGDAGPREDISGRTEDSISLTKVDGKWCITYAALKRPEKNNYKIAY